jgi:hypothetical protein
MKTIIQKFTNELEMLRFFSKQYVPVHILDTAYIEMELKNK